MKTSNVSFAQLRGLLLELGFTESRPNGMWRFEHAESGAAFFFRSYESNDCISVPDLDSARTHLEWRGLLSGHVFDDSLTKTPA